MEYKHHDMLAFDMGRYLYRVAPESTNKELTAHAISFVQTFHTNINLDNVEQRDEFFYHVGRGFEFQSNQ